MDFGAFVEILPGKEGLCHISKLSRQRVEKVSDVLKEGQQEDAWELHLPCGDRQRRPGYPDTQELCEDRGNRCQ